MKRNRSVKAIVEAYDAQQSYTVVSFKDGHRVMTYGHLDPLAAIAYVQGQNLAGHETLVFPEGALAGLEGASREKAFFVQKLKELKASS